MIGPRFLLRIFVFYASNNANYVLPSRHLQYKLLHVPIQILYSGKVWRRKSLINLANRP